MATAGNDGAYLLTDHHALEKIFSFVCFEDRLSLATVCRTFQEILQQSGLHWECIELNGYCVAPAEAELAPDFWRKLLAWFGPRGASVRQLRVENFRSHLNLPSFNEQTATMSTLFSLLPGLRELAITRSVAASSSGVLVAATRLTGLKSLKIDLQGPLPTSHIDALAALPLERLCIVLVRTLEGTSNFEGAFPSHLTRVTSLKKLVLEGSYHGHWADQPEFDLPCDVSNWKQLTHLRLANLGIQSLPESMGCLFSLEELCLGRNLLGLEPHSLPDSLTQLTRLRRLDLSYNHFEAGPPPIIGQLTSLVELDLAGNLWGGVFSDLPPSFSCLTRLQYLTLTNCQLHSLPPVVTRMASLILLKLNINRLQDLPRGPYLRSLQMLDMAHNSFGCYPPALADAPQLHVVAFQHNGVHYTNPALAAQAAQPPPNTGAMVPTAQAAAGPPAQPPLLQLGQVNPGMPPPPAHIPGGQGDAAPPQPPHAAAADPEAVGTGGDDGPPQAVVIAGGDAPPSADQQADTGAALVRD